MLFISWFFNYFWIYKIITYMFLSTPHPYLSMLYEFICVIVISVNKSTICVVWQRTWKECQLEEQNKIERARVEVCLLCNLCKQLTVLQVWDVLLSFRRKWKLDLFADFFKEKVKKKGIFGSYEQMSYLLSLFYTYF